MRAVITVAMMGLAGCASSERSALTRPAPAAPAPGRPSLFAQPWRWTDEAGREVRLARWAGSTMVVSAFFTSCGRTCPLTVEKLRRIEDAYRAAGRRAEFVLVTIDPGNDDAEELQRYKREHRLPEAWHLLRGSPEQTEALTDLLDLHVLALTDHVVHGSRIVVFDGRGAPARSFSCCSFDPSEAVL